MEQALLPANKVVCPRTGHGLDAPDARGDTGLAHDLEEPDLRGVAHVRTATELHREAWNLHDPDDVAILLAKEGHRAGITRFLIRNLVRRDGNRPPDLAVYERLDLLETFSLHRSVMSKVETQAFGRHQ